MGNKHKYFIIQFCIFFAFALFGVVEYAQAHGQVDITSSRTGGNNAGTVDNSVDFPISGALTHFGRDCVNNTPPFLPPTVHLHGGNPAAISSVTVVAGAFDGSSINIDTFENKPDPSCNPVDWSSGPNNFYASRTFDTSTLPNGNYSSTIRIRDDQGYEFFFDITFTVSHAACASVTVDSNVVISWSLAGPSGYSRAQNSSDYTDTNTPTGSYNLTYPNSVVISSTTYNRTSGPTTPQTCNSGGNITFTLIYTAASGPPEPSADIKANGSDGPITIANNTAATISWTSSDATSCSVAPTGWGGTSNAGISTGNLTSSVTYTITCTGPGGNSNPDSVTVNVSGPSPTCSGGGPSGFTTTANSGTHRVFAYGVSNASSVNFPTWSEPTQDDIIWYPGTNQGGGTWYADVNLASHPGIGTISVHIYLYGSSTVFCGTANFTRTSATAPTVALRVRLPSQPPGSGTTGPLTIPVSNANWPSYQSRAYLSWTSTDATSCQLQFGNGTPTGWPGNDPNTPTVDTTPFYSSGAYSYRVVCSGPGGSGTSNTVTINVIAEPTCTGAQPDGDQVIGTGGTRRTTATGVTAAAGDAITGVLFYVWTDAGGQDDMGVYNGVNEGGGVWAVNIPLASHPDQGGISVHAYITSNYFTVATPNTTFCDYANFSRIAGGTITVTTNVQTNWTLNGNTAMICNACPASGTVHTYTSMPARGYTLTNVPALSGYGTPVVSPSLGTSLTLANNGTIAWTITYPLAAPVLTSISSNCATGISLAWTDNSANESGFRVLRSTTAGGPYSTVDTKAANVTTDSDSPATGTRYYYVIQAYISSPAQTANSNELNVFHAACTANLTSSTKTIIEVEGASYVPDVTINDGDQVTWSVVIRNTGTDAAVVTKLCDYPSDNIDNISSASESGPLGLSGNPSVSAAFCPPLVSGGPDGWRFNLTGTLPTGQNSTITFDSDFVSNGSSLEVCSNTAVVTYNDSDANGKTRQVKYTRLCNKGGGGVPDFNEVAP
jgi:hypothetical protein